MKHKFALGLALVFLVFTAGTLSACQATVPASPATATARARRVIAQATEMSLQYRETQVFDEKQATASAQDRMSRLEKASGWPLILVEPFENNSNEWIVGEETSEFADAIFTLADGVYRWEMTPHQGFLWWNRPSVSPVEDFYFGVDVRLVNGPISAYMGLMLHQDENGNYYLFSLRSDGYFAFDRYFNEQWLSLVGWSPSAGRPEGEVNRLEVVAEGGIYSLFVNGTWVADVENPAIASGLCGLIVGMDETGEQATWEFDNLELRSGAIPEQVSIPTATPVP